MILLESQKLRSSEKVHKGQKIKLDKIKIDFDFKLKPNL